MPWSRHVLMVGLVLFPTAHAVPIGDLPVLDTVVTDDGGYVAWRLFVPAGAQVGYVLKGKALDASRFMLGVWHSTADDPSPVEADSIGFPFPTISHRSLILEAAGLGSALHSHSEPGSAGWWAASWDRETVTEDGVWTYVLAAPTVGKVRTTFEIDGGAGARVLSRTSGPAFFFTDESDFAGGTRIMTENPAGRVDYPAIIGPTLPIMEGARYIAGASAPLEVRDTLFGRFVGYSNSGRLRLSTDAPGLGHAVVPSGCAPLARCVQAQPYAGAAPGAYAFHIDEHADYFSTAPVCWPDVPPCIVPPVVVAWGADVRLP